MSRFQAQRGTEDVLPKDSASWRRLERTFEAVVSLYGYEEIRTPTFEESELFIRSSGETSEVVDKQLYRFMDKGGRDISLKPEGTAPAIRAYLEHSLAQQGQVTRLWYCTPIFRYERPQKGRLREAHQVGLELIGSPSPAADAEVIEVTVRFYEALGISGLQVMLNCIGRTETRSRFTSALLDHIKPWLDSIEPDQRERALKNPLRLLDNKDPSIQEAVNGMPPILDFLEDESREHFESLKSILSRKGIRFEVRPSIVRGLDYYTDTVFEVQSDSLGSQNALCGGGRYDGLVEQMGGPPTPSVGVAMGVERALMVLESLGKSAAPPGLDAFIIAATDEGRVPIPDLAYRLRALGLSCAYDFDARSLKNQFKQADRAGARFAVIIGDDEMKSSSATIRDMASGAQALVPLDAVPTAIGARP